MNYFIFLFLLKIQKSVDNLCHKKFRKVLTTWKCVCYNLFVFWKRRGGLAQLARASALHAGGRGFESHILHHLEMNRTRDSSFFYVLRVKKNERVLNIKLYKKTPMNIGLFLFERTMDHRIITKKYYEQQNGKES